MKYQSTWWRVFTGARMVLGTAVVAGVMAFSGAAQAVTLHTGSLAPGDQFQDDRIYTEADAELVLDNWYVFTADGDSTTYSTAISLNPFPPTPAGNDMGIADFSIGWYDAIGGNLISELLVYTDDAGNWILTTAGTSLLQLFSNAQTYYLGIKGTILGNGGQYTLTVHAIPLPAGLLLFLSGLLGIGVLGRYKAKRHEPATA